MARSRGPRFKECRALGLNVHGHPKAMKRNTPARDSKKLSNYGQQLLEKQRLRAYYGVLEKQMRLFYKKASKAAVPVEALIFRLEQRLDNVVYRIGFGTTLRQARQMVNHGHVAVNGKRIDIPSYEIKPGDKITLLGSNELVKAAHNRGISANPYPYISYNDNSKEAVFERVPAREEIPIEIQDNLVAEYYSKMG